MIQELFRKKYPKKSYYGNHTYYISWFQKYSGKIYGLAVILMVSFSVFAMIKYDEMDTWTIVDKDTGTKYANARYASHNSSCNEKGWCSECEDNIKPIYGYESLDKIETNQTVEGVVNPLYLKIGEQFITLKNWEKVNYKVVNQGDYCKNRGVFEIK